MSDPGLIVVDGLGGLTIDSIDLVRPGDGLYVAWTILDLSPLWPVFPAMRAGSSLVPQRRGRIPNDRYEDETTVSLNGWVTGVLDENGDPHSDPVMGLLLNMKYLYDNVVSPDQTTRTAVLEAPDGATTYGGEVQVAIVPGPAVEGAYDKPLTILVTVHDAVLEELGS